jgi:hypothetical protein
MNQSPTPSSITTPQPLAVKDVLARSTFFGWRWGLAAIVAGLAASFFLLGYALIYWRNADMDFMVIYNAFLLNEGKPQQFFDHTAYITIVMAKFWFQLLHALGLLDAWSLSAIPSASNLPAFEAAMTSAVRAGRLLAWLTATGCVLTFAALIRSVIRDWRIALLATAAFAFSGGMAIHLRILRSELLAACPVIFALLILIVVGRRAGLWRPLAIAVAAGLCVLGLENKVQAILLIGALPLVVMPFGSAESASVAFWRTPPAWLAAAIAAIAAIASAWIAWPLAETAFDPALLDAVHFHPLLLGRFGVYQTALLILIAGCMIAYAATWRVSAAETLASMSAVAVGGLLALLLLDVEYSAINVRNINLIAVFHPLEKMLTFADSNTTAVANGAGWSGSLLLLLRGVGSVLARYSFVLHPSPRAAVFFTWLIVPGIFLAWRRDQRLVAIQALLLLLAAIGIDAIGVSRGLKAEYFIFTDPLLILATAILFDALSFLRFPKWAYPAAFMLLALHIVGSQAEPLKAAFSQRGPETICQWNQHYLPLLPLPWCKLPPVRP